MHPSVFIRAAALASAFLACAGALAARAAEPIVLEIDTTKAPTQNVIFTHEIVPVQPGRTVLYYPKWIPGEHSAAGPIANLSGIVITANGAPVTWRREPHDLYALDVDVPAGISSLDVAFTYLGATFGN
jgi:hypothetical protein